MLLVVLVTAVLWSSQSTWAQSATEREFELRIVFEQYRELAGQERFAEAEPYAREALALGEVVFGPEHENVGYFLRNLAELHNLQGRPNAAVPLMERAVRVFRGTFGEDNTTVAVTLVRLASTYDATGRRVEAENLGRYGLEILQGIYDADHPTMAPALQLLASIYLDTGRYVESAEMQVRLANIGDTADKSFGMCHTQM